MEFIAFQSAFNDVMGAFQRVKAVDRDSKDASPELKVAYATIRAELVAKHKASVDALKSKMETFIASADIPPAE